MRGFRRGLLAIGIGVLTAGSVTACGHATPDPDPACTVTAADSASGAATDYTLSTEQADSAATIAAVGLRLDVPPRAITVALATAFQESGMRNLDHGDRDSLGLFQQRPSQGWGSAKQIRDPIYASKAFYTKLKAQSGWTKLSINDAAQRVQRSGFPRAYAQWEDDARAIAAALVGQSPAALSCHDITIGVPSSDLVATARAELGTAKLSGDHPTARGWSLSSWLVAHAVRVGVDQVSFDGHTWTAATGAWTQTGAADGVLSLHRFTAP